MNSIVDTAIAFYSCPFCSVDEQLAIKVNNFYNLPQLLWPCVGTCKLWAASYLINALVFSLPILRKPGVPSRLLLKVYSTIIGPICDQVWHDIPACLSKLISPSDHVMFYLLYINTNKIPNHFSLTAFCSERHNLLCSHSNQ